MNARGNEIPFEVVADVRACGRIRVSECFIILSLRSCSSREKIHFADAVSITRQTAMWDSRCAIPTKKPLFTLGTLINVVHISPLLTELSIVNVDQPCDRNTVECARKLCQCAGSAKQQRIFALVGFDHDMILFIPARKLGENKRNNNCQICSSALIPLLLSLDNESCL